MARTLEKLSDLKVRRIQIPGYLGDGGGLYLQVSPSLSKSWVFRYQMNGRAREMGLGAFHSFGLSDARKRAMKCRQLVADGIDPIDDRKSAQHQKRLAEARAVAFGRCAALYIEAHRSGWKNAKHAAQWESTLATYCKPIWNVPVDEVDTELVMLCLNPIWTTKTETASRVRGRIESVLAWATVRKLRTGDNPAAWRNHLDQLLPKRSEVQKVKPRPALPYVEIPTFMSKLRQHQGLSARALELQILTTTRPGESAGAQWEEIDLAKALWIIPAERMKAEKEHRVPLSPAAVELLRSLIPKVKGEPIVPSGHVFPGVKGQSLTTAAGEKLMKGMHASDIARGGTGYMDPREKRPCVPHGFRSCFRDWAAETTKHSREVIEKALAHLLKDASEAAYQRGDLLTRRAKLMNDWERYCRSAA